MDPCVPVLGLASSSASILPIEAIHTGAAFALERIERLP